MQIYQIRVLEDDGKTALIASEVQFDDSTATQFGKGVAAGRKFEVWRGMDCIYGPSPNTGLLDLSPP